MRARAILEEQAELDHHALDGGDGDTLVGRAARAMEKPPSEDGMKHVL
jgi:hypothetical protein